MWFEELTGFKEIAPDQVRAQLTLKGKSLSSKVNGRSWIYGPLETPSLKELRQRSSQLLLPEGRLNIEEIVADVQVLHQDPQNAGAFFQVASQFNLLEMLSPQYTPEMGVGIYENDPTQGPACAIAAGAGTIYRNYFVEVNGKTGQTADHQVDCLEDMGKILGNDNQQYWRMQNGYVIPSLDGLRTVHDQIEKMEAPAKDELRQQLRIGLQWNTQVTLGNCRHLVTQAFCSALPVAYSMHPHTLWEGFARLVLEAAYEATFHAASINMANTGNRTVFLTLLGGGAFGNKMEWILDALENALHKFSQIPLLVKVVSYGAPNPILNGLFQNLNR